MALSFRRKFHIFTGRPRNTDADALRAAVRDEFQEYAENSSADQGSLRSSQKALKIVQKSLVDVPEKATRIDVNLKGTTLGSPGEIVLGRALLTCKTLRSLSLVDCGLTADSVKTMVELINNPMYCIEFINFSDNPIRSAGVIALSRAFKENTTITDICLANVDMGDDGAKPLAESFENVRIPRKLDIRRNIQLTSQAAKLMLAVAESNVFFTDVQFDQSVFGSDLDLKMRLEKIRYKNTEIAGIIETLLQNATQRTFKKKLLTFRRSLIHNSISEDTTGPMYKWMSNQKSDTSFTKSLRFDVACTLDIGRRHEMQDVVAMKGCFLDQETSDYFGLFDGHGGRNAASYCASRLHVILGEHIQRHDDPEQALKESFLACSKEMHAWSTVTGTTAVVALILESKLYVANIGDSKALLCRGGQAVLITRDHKPSDPLEKDRIEKLGGVIQDQRVSGQLSVTRALGDSNLAPYVIALPDVHAVEISPDDDFLLMASDGVWDVMSNDDVISFVAANLTESRRLNLETSRAKAACDAVVAESMKRGSNDNISVTIICFNDRGSSVPALNRLSHYRTDSLSSRNSRNGRTSRSSSIIGVRGSSSTDSRLSQRLGELDPIFTASDSELSTLVDRAEAEESHSNVISPRHMKDLERLNLSRESGYFDDSVLSEFKSVKEQEVDAISRSFKEEMMSLMDNL